MKKIPFIISFIFLLSCGSSSESTDEPESPNEIDISGKWVECVVFTPLDIAYTEVVYSGDKLETTIFGGMDNQCINVNPNPVAITKATLILDNPHLSVSGLMVYDYTLINVTGWDYLSNMTTPKPNIYSILYLDGDKLYTGKLTVTLDGTSEAKRPNEIQFLTFLTKL